MSSRQRPIPLRVDAIAPPPTIAVPAQPTPLIGREPDLAALQALLWRSEVRMITLTGPGGVGKTRLAVAIAEAAGQLFADGVHFVDLAAVRGPELVPLSIARALAIPPDPHQSTATTIQGWLRERDILLVLDNCEQVAAAASQFARWLGACPGLVILATSRVALQLRWEHEYPVAPLSLPGHDRPIATDDLAIIPSVALFVARARSARPDFALTDQNAAPISTLCQRLDGLPLAIELAAQLMRFLSPQALVDRLETQRTLPASVLRDLPERQQSLHATVDWSYELLSPDARSLFRRLAVLPGSFPAALAEALSVAFDADTCADNTQARLGELVEHNLLRREWDDAGSLRFAMLNTIQDYAAVQLAASGELPTTQRAFATWVLDLTEQIAPNLIGQDQALWLARIDQESHLIARALRQAIEQRETAAALKLCAALWWSWYMRGFCAEGRAALEAALALPGEEQALARAQSLIGAGALAYLQGDVAAAVANGTAGLALGRALGDATTIALGLNLLGNIALWKGDHTLARLHYEEQIASQRRAAKTGPLAPAARFGLALSLNNLGVVWQDAGDDRRAIALHEESLAIMRTLGDRQGSAHALLRIGEARARLGQHQAASELTGESLDLFRALGDRWGIARSLLVLGRVALQQSQAAVALPPLREGLAAFHHAGMKLGVIQCCEALAAVAALQAQFARATRLLAAATAQRAALGAARTVREDAEHAALVERLRRALDARDFDAAWSNGQILTTAQAIAAALTTEESPPLPALQADNDGANAARLTRRERQVAALLARGLTNRQIAEQLFNSERTIETHVQKIAGKLGFTRRTQIATWANAHGLTEATAVR
jgi:predicted ATPase/DNA-binding NarL/FixJ family response regulator